LRYRKAALELVAGLLEDDERFGTDATQPPTVVPVVHDALDGDRPLLEAALRHYGGQLLVADPVVTERDGDPDTGLVEVVREVADLYPLDIEIDASGGHVSVTTADPAKANDSHRVVLATLAILLSDQLASASLTALAYPAAGLDSTRLDFLWRLLVHQVPPVLPADLRTFVPIVHGPVSVRDHCAGNPSARWVIRAGFAHKRRRDPDALSGQVARIAGDLSRPLVLFLGAGASASARIPQGDAVRDQAIQRLLGTRLSPLEIPERFHTWVVEEGRLLPDEDAMDRDAFIRLLTLERVLHEEFRDLLNSGRSRSDSNTVQTLMLECDSARLRMPRGRQALWRILQAHTRALVVEVNFDLQVEDQCPVVHAVYATPADFDRARDHVAAFLSGDRGAGAPVLKIHGTITDPDSLVADLDQTVSGLSTAVREALDVVVDAGPLDWIWVGCSMRDRDINQWMRTKREKQIHDWWVDPLPGIGIPAFVRETRPPAMQLELLQRVITESSDAFLVALADRVEAVAAGA
jgi:SIR2-like domain